MDACNAMLDLNEVRMFVQVVRATSFAEASRRLNVPPNTLSRRVRQLEATLDTRLMQRSTRKLNLTAAGHAFFERCASAVDGVMEAGKELAYGSSKPSGTVRVAAPADFLDLFHIEWVADFLTRYSQVRLEFVLDDARADLIEEGIDVAFRGGPARDSRSAYRQLGPQSLNLVASPAYVAARGTPQSLQELARHDCLTVAKRHGPTSWTLHGPKGAEEVRITGRFSANSSRLLLKACAAGLGIAMLPGMMIAADLKAGRLVHVLPAYGRDGADFNVLVPSLAQVPAAVQAFVEFAVERLQFMLSGGAATLATQRKRRMK